MLANPDSGRLHCRNPSQFLNPNRPKCFRFPNCPRSPCFPSKSKFCNLSLLLPRQTGRKGPGIRALSEPGGVSTSGGPQGYPQPYSVKIPVGDRHILVETGHIGRQASASVTVTDGETIIYTSVCLADTPSEPSDFFPLSVHYQERFSAAGRTSGGFFKREGRAKDHEVLICRLIDRPLRPTMLNGFYHETQILSWVLSYDGLHSPDSLAVTAAGIAVALSEVPNSKTVAGVRIGLVGDKFIVNPTTKEMEDSELDLLVAGTDNAILMIEGYCDFLTEEKLLQAVEVGQDAIRAICNEVEALVKKCGKPKMLDAIKLPPPELYNHVEEIAGDELVRALQIKDKIPRRKALLSLEGEVLTILTEKGYISKDAALIGSESIPDIFEDEEEDEEVVVDGEVDEGDVHIKPSSRKSTPLFFSEVDVKLVFKEVTSKFLRRRIVESLAVVTLGDKQMAQRVDNLVDVDEWKRFYLQYTFPPSCVGEVGRNGAPSRREIGHGMLAERALEPILPSEDDFPYTIRVESTITESNGSSSMASVCGGCLALQDAGVPIKSSIVGIAMGMVLETEEFGGNGAPLILSDITGSEDASGDMDFKWLQVAGNEDGVTAFQMDIKVSGITLPVMREALLQAKDGRKHIIAEMLKCSSPPSRLLSKYAPLIHIMKVNPEKVNLIIGSGGKKVKSIIEETGVDAIDTQEDGIVRITGRDLSSIEKTKAIITNLTMVPSVGDIFRNCEIKSIVPYGVFVEIAPGREGLCHISELSSEWLAKAEDAVKVGEHIDVKLIEVNEKGQLRLSRKALLPDTDAENASSKQPTGDSNDVASQETSDKGSTKKIISTPKRDLAGELPQKKFIRRLVSAAKDRPNINKDKTKKSSKVVSNVSSKDENTLVNGEANIG
ncbi:hypothetical protein C1H46_020292 [Malus baccata]|uniref:polyribonucleotide nucleotidyltransferase n=1 Tax=Malus baccata TaxID=106549 RepID=A0A540M5R2_MALBA|nr:hypothetical protein C1H46_020292 [Malus baccata]